MSNAPVSYQTILKDEESLAKFLTTLSQFDRMFCDLMVGGGEYTLRLEVHGAKGELIHCRVLSDDFQRPRGGNGRAKKGTKWKS